MNPIFSCHGQTRWFAGHAWSKWEIVRCTPAEEPGKVVERQERKCSLCGLTQRARVDFH